MKLLQFFLLNKCHWQWLDKSLNVKYVRVPYGDCERITSAWPSSNSAVRLCDCKRSIICDWGRFRYLKFSLFEFIIKTFKPKTYSDIINKNFDSMTAGQARPTTGCRHWIANCICNARRILSKFADFWIEGSDIVWPNISPMWCVKTGLDLIIFSLYENL